MALLTEYVIVAAGNKRCLLIPDDSYRGMALMTEYVIVSASTRMMLMTEYVIVATRGICDSLILLSAVAP